MQNINIWQRLEDFFAEASNAFKNIDDLDALQTLQKKYLGKKSELQDFMKHMKSLSSEEKPRFGAMLNTFKNNLQLEFDTLSETLKQKKLQNDLQAQTLDLSLPPRSLPKASPHPIKIIQKQIEELFIAMGFDIALGPQAEWDFFNFEALNFPPDHPARDMQDTLILENGALLRTHTSPVQIRTLLTYEPPIRIIAPGAVYRRDDDTTHSPVFHQIEGLHVDKNLSMANLKAVLQHFARSLFGAKTNIRLRPSFFPFTEPSVEVDIACIFCNAKGCRTCKQTGWIEILGAGMVDPNVLIATNIDPEQWSAWAFGIGVERVAMLLYGISDIRLFFESDLRFLQQF